jgi:hypothetical protein
MMPAPSLSLENGNSSLLSKFGRKENARANLKSGKTFRVVGVLIHSQ